MDRLGYVILVLIISSLQYWEAFSIFIQLICRFSTASEIPVWVEIVQSVAINVVTSTHPS